MPARRSALSHRQRLLQFALRVWRLHLKRLLTPPAGTDADTTAAELQVRGTPLLLGRLRLPAAISS
jgi:hypothetical protein